MDIDAGLQRVGVLLQFQLAFASTEQGGKNALEVDADLLEGVHEPFPGHLVQALDGALQTVFGLFQVVALLLDLVQPGLFLLVLFQGLWVERAQVLELALGRAANERLRPLVAFASIRP